MSEDRASIRTLSILHITIPGPVGGLESVVRATTSGLRKRGHRVGVVAVVEPDRPYHPFIEALRQEGVETIQLSLPARAYFREIRLVHEEIERFDPDVLHTHGSRADLLHFPTARALGIPITTTLHGSSMRGGLAGLSERLQAVLLKWFDAVIAVSRPLALELIQRGIPADRVHFIPNAPGSTVRSLSRARARKKLDLRDCEEPVIGWVGRLIPVKGADVFLRALAQVCDLEWGASIIGDGPERDSLQDLASELGIGARVRFHGSVPEAAKYQPAFDLFVLSSHSEGIPMVLFEAVAAGIPIIASAVGGVPDVLSDREAFLVQAGNIDGLAEALRDSLDDLKAANARAALARARVEEEFSRELWINRYEDLYYELASKSS